MTTRILVVFSFVLIAAHFFRMGLIWLSVVSVLAAMLLLIRKRWSERSVQLFLYIAFLEWVRALVILVYVRQLNGQPWLRLVTIMAAVSLLTLLSGVLFRKQVAKSRR